MSIHTDASRDRARVAGSLQLLIQSGEVARCLKERLRWPVGRVPDRVWLNRLWVGRAGRISFELSIDFSDAYHSRPVLLQGVVGLPAKKQRVHAVPRIRGRWLRGARTMVEDCGIWVCTPDRDSDLPTVRDFLSRSRLSGLWKKLPDLAGVLRPDIASVIIRSQVVAYRLGKRCVLRLEAREGGAYRRVVYVKFRKHAMLSDTLHTLQDIAALVDRVSGGLVQIPKVVDRCPQGKFVAYEGVPDGAEPGGNDESGIKVAALALASLHRMSPDVHVPYHGPRAEIGTVDRWTPVISDMYPNEAPMLVRLVSKLCSHSLIRMRAATCLIHRDFHAAQLMRIGDKVWIVDFDTVSAGHAELDVATYVAHLALEMLLANASPDDACALGGALISSYLEAGGKLRADLLPFYLGSAMARLGAIFLARGTAPDAIMQLWQAARESLDGTWLRHW